MVSGPFSPAHQNAMRGEMGRFGSGQSILPAWAMHGGCAHRPRRGNPSRTSGRAGPASPPRGCCRCCRSCCRRTHGRESSDRPRRRRRRPGDQAVSPLAAPPPGSGPGSVGSGPSWRGAARRRRRPAWRAAESASSSLISITRRESSKRVGASTGPRSRWHVLLYAWPVCSIRCHFHR